MLIHNANHIIYKYIISPPHMYVGHGLFETDQNFGILNQVILFVISGSALGITCGVGCVQDKKKFVFYFMFGMYSTMVFMTFCFLLFDQIEEFNGYKAVLAVDLTLEVPQLTLPIAMSVVAFNFSKLSLYFSSSMKALYFLLAATNAKDAAEEMKDQARDIKKTIEDDIVPMVDNIDAS